MPAVSVILPTYDRLEFLRPAVDSVIAQTWADWELIIADDGSGAETLGYLTALDDPRIQVLRLPHSGAPGVARNAALRVARGAHVAFLDSDDVWAPAKLERQLAALAAAPGARWSYTLSSGIDAAGRPRAIPNPSAAESGWIIESLLRSMARNIAMPAVMAERRLIEEVGGFDDDQRWCEDLDLWFRLAMASPVVAVPDALCAVRAHDRHFGGNRVAEYASRVRLYGKTAARLGDPRLRALCDAVRGEQALALSGLLSDRGEVAAVWRTLAAAARFSWRRPSWWWGACKAAARPLLPGPWLASYRRLRRR